MTDISKQTASAGRRREPLFYERSLAAVKLYRGWDLLEKRCGRGAIIDIDLSAGSDHFTFATRREVLEALLRLHDRFDSSDDQDDFLRFRIQASLIYVKALMGEQKPFPEYIRATLGAFPSVCTEEYLAALRRSIQSLLEHYGLVYSRGSAKAFKDTFVILDPNKIVSSFLKDQESCLNILRLAGIPVPSHLNFRLKRTAVDAYWSTWLSRSRRGTFTISINLHRRRQYDRGRPQLLCLHEVCGHLVQRILWTDKLASGELDLALGTTTVHSPEVVLSEGLGQTVADLLRPVCVSEGGDLPTHLLLSRELQFHEHLVLNNAQLMLFEGEPLSAAFSYTMDHLPFVDADEVEAELRDRGTNILFRSYQMAYGVGQMAIREAIKLMDVKQQRSLFLNLYSRPMMPTHFSRVVSQIKRT